MKAQLVVILFLFMTPCVGQQLQIYRPDSSVYSSISQYDFVAIRTLSRQYIAGQLVALTADTLTVAERRQTKRIAVSDLIGLKKTSTFGITARRLSDYVSLAPIILLPGVTNSNAWGDRTWAGRALIHAAIAIPAGVGLGLLMNGRPLRRMEKGYTFKVVP